ncbi:MAG: hypothetical protein JNL97_17945, partial [Verrucomicrobiales bacterium]|nr:hypothetical protein [Verrucomicrobiales bacterium]
TGLPVATDNVGLLEAGETAELGYTIRAHPDAPTGASLEAQARVIFGDAAPVDTNRVSVTLDAHAPVTTLATRTLSANRYFLEWSAIDEASGSGVQQYSVYVTLDGYSYSVLQAQTTSTSLSYVAPEGTTPGFLVLAADNAGNLEEPPIGLQISLFPPSLNLGSVPSVVPLDRQALPILPPPNTPAANSLFLQALLGVPGALPTSRLPAWERLLSPFSAASFVRGIETSGAGVTAIGVAIAPDGSLWVSGGPGRNQLFRVGVGGSNSPQAIATLDTPIYALAFDRSGGFWATTGGGRLLELDPTTGVVLAAYGNTVTLGLAADPTKDRLFVATSEGVQIFDTVRRTFTPFSKTRVEGLAVDGTGSLWGIEWPGDGGVSRAVLRFDTRGQASVAVDLGLPAIALAFGAADTRLSNLLFVSSATGELVAVDTLSLQHLTLATGGVRGAFLATSDDGRLYVAGGHGVDILFPVRPPQVLASDPADRAGVPTGVSQATITFDASMFRGASTDARSVTRLENYRVVDMVTGLDVRIGAALYDPETRRVTLVFDALSASTYELRVAPSLQDDLGNSLAGAYAAEFVVAEDRTSTLRPGLEFANT